MKGRAPKPPRMRALDGDPGKRGSVKAPPEPPVISEIDPPKHLDAFGAKMWRSLQPQLARYVGFSEMDMLGLELLCASYSRYRQALDALWMIDGTQTVFKTVYETRGRNGTQKKTRPEYVQAIEEVRVMKSLMAEFGLTPAARTRLEGVAQMGLPFGNDPLAQLQSRYATPPAAG